MTKYITEEGDRHIAAFTYKGKDLSITYEYLWSPLADKLLLLTPPTIAPNTLTLAGFIINVVGTVVLCLQLPFNSSAPTWSLVLYGLSVFSYQTLDNLDGKQARKLKNSTPLGMIMDHGCDALGTIALSAGMARVLCIQSPYLFLWTYLCVVLSFYMSAWVQYYSNGVMILGKFNGVDEGIPIIWLSALLTAALGQDFWKLPLSIAGHTVLVNQVVAGAIILSGFVQILSVFGQSGQEFTKDVGKAVKDLIHVALLIATVTLVILFSDLADTHIVGLCLGLAFTMSRTISYTLVCSVAEMEFRQFQPSLLVFTLSYSIYVLFLQEWVRPQFVVYGVMAFAIVNYSVFVVRVSNHIADVLQIRIFRVFEPKQPKSN